MTQIRDTRQKRAIREVFAAAARPLSLAEAQVQAAKIVAGISIATIYRNVNALVEERWLSPVGIPGEPSRYEVAGKGHHHHFHCRTCGKIYDLNSCVLQPRPKIPRGFRLTGHEVFLYGVCSSCETPSRALRR